MLGIPFYDPEKSYEKNFAEGPFGAFADGSVQADSGEPAYEFLGRKVFLPFGIPAGPLVNGAFVKAALDKGFDLPVYKTVRTASHPCHPWPNVLAVETGGDLTMERAAAPLVATHDYREPLAITNSFGVPSRDPSFWQEDLAGAVRYAKPGQAVIGSYQGTKRGDGDVASYIADFTRGAKLLKETGVKIIEINLSCPNEGTAHLLCFDTERVRRILEAVRGETGNLPIILKIAYFQDVAELRKLVEAVAPLADAFSAINTISAEIRDSGGGQALPGEGRLRSGVCGAAIKWAGLDMVGKLKTLREELGARFAIVGVGGVAAPEDYMEYRAAGADAVMSATGAMWHPHLAREIKQAVLREGKDAGKQ